MFRGEAGAPGLVFKPGSWVGLGWLGLARVWILPVEEEKKETGRTQVLETKTWGTRPLPILVPGHPSVRH